MRRAPIVRPASHIQHVRTMSRWSRCYVAIWPSKPYVRRCTFDRRVSEATDATSVGPTVAGSSQDGKFVTKASLSYSRRHEPLWVGLRLGSIKHAPAFVARPADGPLAGLKLKNCTRAVVTDLSINGNSTDCAGFGLEACQDCLVTGVEAFGHGATSVPSGGGQLVSVTGVRNSWKSCTVRDSTPGSSYRGFSLGNANVGFGESDLLVESCQVRNNDATGIGMQSTRARILKTRGQEHFQGQRLPLPPVPGPREIWCGTACRVLAAQLDGCAPVRAHPGRGSRSAQSACNFDGRAAFPGVSCVATGGCRSS
jgi:hypothetical protein